MEEIGSLEAEQSVDEKMISKIIIFKETHQYITKVVSPTRQKRFLPF